MVLRIVLPVVLMAIVTFGASPRTKAQETAIQAGILVVDLQRIDQEAEAMQSARRQLGAFRDRFQQEFETREAELKAREQDLLQQRALLSEDALRERESALRKEIADFQRLVQTRRDMLIEAERESVARFHQMVSDIMADEMRKRQAILMLPMQSVIFSDVRLNITEDVLARANAEVPMPTFSLNEAGE